MTKIGVNEYKDMPNLKEEVVKTFSLKPKEEFNLKKGLNEDFGHFIDGLLSEKIELSLKNRKNLIAILDRIVEMRNNDLKEKLIEDFKKAHCRGREDWAIEDDENISLIGIKKIIEKRFGDLE